VLFWFFCFCGQVPRKPFQRIPILIACAVVLVVCLVRWLQPAILQHFEWTTLDMRVRQALRFPTTTATNLGFIGINDDSVKAVQNGSLGFKFGLLWPRQVYARLINELTIQGAKAIAFDVIFGELREDHPPVYLGGTNTVESDEFFAQEMRRAGNTLIALTREITPPNLFLSSALALGDISADADADGVLRRARAFRDYRFWHPLFQKLADAPEYGVDLRLARLEPGFLVLPRKELEAIRFPLDKDGNFEAADLIGEKLPAGMPPKAKPFTEQRVWHLGIVLAAQALALDLAKAEVDLARGRILLRGEGGLRREVPVDSEGYFYVNWVLPVGSTRLSQAPAEALLAQNYSRLRGQTNELSAAWQGKLVVVGSSVEGNNISDRGPTPLGAHTLLVSAHWNVANSILTGQFIRQTPLGGEMGIIVLLGLTAAAITWRFRVLNASAAVVLLVTGYVVLGFVAYARWRIWLPLVYPVGGALVLMHVSLMVWRVVFEQAEKRHVRSIFSTVVAPEIVTELLKAESLSLGGARREITILFADVRGFTEFTDVSQERAGERVRLAQLTGAEAEACYDEQARETISTINLYLGTIADTVIRHGGALDKFIGDCVMAFWGAPLQNPRHALDCVRAAIEAQRAIYAENQRRAAENQRIEAENRNRAASDLPALLLLPLLQLGTGINTGMATVGLMGSGGAGRVRMGNYTVFGREVNLASRLEGASGRGRIFVGETTYQHLMRDDPGLAKSCVEQPPVQLKGFRTSLKVYEVPWRTPEMAVPAQWESKAREAASAA
jgi:class 3 adenylate cyclase/CHASE2 domain-containing sensor protein